MNALNKIKSLSRMAQLLCVGLAMFFAPIDARAADSCYQSATFPTPSCSTSYSSYIYITWGSISSSCYAYYNPRYVVYRGTSSTFSWSGVTRLTTTTSRYYYDYSAAAGTTYYYWIGVVDESDNSVWVDYSKKDWGRLGGGCDFSTANLPTPSCSISYCDYVSISWSAVTGECSSRVRNYVVYRSTSSTFSWSGVTKLGTTTGTTYYDRTATPGTTYYYWIGVTDSSTGSIWVNYNKKDWGKRSTGCCDFSTANLPTPSCSISYCDYVSISWSALTGSCASRVRNYVVYRSTSSTFSWSGATKLGTTTGTTYYDRTATPGTTYYYWIGVTDSSTGSIWVNYNKKDWGKRSTSGCGCDFSTANLPTPSCSTSYSSYVYISWSAVTGECSSRVRNYVVYRSTSSTFSWSGVTKLGTTTNKYYYDYTARCGTTYYYWIGVTDSYTGSIWVNYNKKDYGRRNSSGCDDCDFSKANLPTPYCSVSYSGYVYISWSALTGDCASRVRNYVVYRSTSSTFNWSTVTKLATTTGTYYYDRSARSGTTYYYWIGVTDSNTGSIWVNYNKKDYGWRY